MTETKLSSTGGASNEPTTVNGGGGDSGSGQQSEAQVNTDGNQESVNAIEPLSTNDIHSLLKNQRRRYVLEYLRANENSARLRDVAEQIAAWENDKELKAITSSERKRAYVGLYQCHLPKMDDADVVTFDQNRGDIEMAANAEQLLPYLDGDGSDEEEAETTARLTADRYLAVAGTSLAVTVAAAAVTGLGAGALGFVIAALTAVSIGALALVDRRTTDEN